MGIEGSGNFIQSEPLAPAMKCTWVNCQIRTSIRPFASTASDHAIAAIHTAGTARSDTSEIRIIRLDSGCTEIDPEGSADVGPLHILGDAAHDAGHAG